MTTDTEAPLSFDIIDDQWLDVLRTNGTVATLSLRELLTTAHEIARLSEASPLTEVALLRFLIALASDGLRLQVPIEDDWTPFAARCQSGLPADAVDAILAPLAGRSNVLDPGHDVFFDGPAVRRVSGWDDPNALQPVSRFLPELPTGTNLAHFNHVSDDTAVLCVACLLKSRAVDAAFARGGLGPSLSRSLLATVSGTEPRYVVPVGETLLQTLLLNLVIGDKSRPPWISIHTGMNADPGPIARMSWRPRLMMPVNSSESGRPCMRCATINHPRFSHAVMLDTYNHKGSPFGSKSDVERWKRAGGDPHLLPFDKNMITLGASHDEWPLRAVTRLLAGGMNTVLDRLSRRLAAIGGPIAITVTSSASNQAKIDDAPHAAVSLPLALLSRTAEDRAAIAAALANIFDKTNREFRERLIPDAVPRLLSDLAVTEELDRTVAAWLESANTRVRVDGIPTSIQNTTDGDHHTPGDDDPLQAAAKHMVNRLAHLSQRELAALRPRGLGGASEATTRQDAFEAVWHRLNLPGDFRRHALREALATVAPIFAVYVASHRPSTMRRSFEARLRRDLNSERRFSSVSAGESSLHRLIDRLTVATPAARDDLLLRLVEVIVDDGSLRRRVSIDFADLLLEVGRWNDPIDPTPARWRQLLKAEPSDQLS